MTKLNISKIYFQETFYKTYFQETFPRKSTSKKPKISPIQCRRLKVDKKKHENGLRIYSRKNIKKIFKDNKASPWKKGKSGRKPSTMKHHHRRGHDTR